MTFEFKDKQKQEALGRQRFRCACCGDRLADQKDEVHHVVPKQTGRRGNREDAWLRTSDNAVTLCGPCHHRVHENGRFRDGAVAPPSYFPFSHGGDRAAHREWAQRADRQWDRKAADLRAEREAAEASRRSARRDQQAKLRDRAGAEREPNRRRSR